jgi:hypothetical protein
MGFGGVYTRGISRPLCPLDRRPPAGHDDRMRLTDSRIRALSKALAREMVARGIVELKSPEYALADLISRIMIADQELESVLEVEARQEVSKQRNLPPPGTGEYQAAFERAKRSAAAKRGMKDY